MTTSDDAAEPTPEKSDIFLHSSFFAILHSSFLSWKICLAKQIGVGETSQKQSCWQTDISEHVTLHVYFQIWVPTQTDAHACTLDIFISCQHKEAITMDMYQRLVYFSQYILIILCIFKHKCKLLFMHPVFGTTDMYAGKQMHKK